MSAINVGGRWVKVAGGGGASSFSERPQGFPRLQTRFTTGNTVWYEDFWNVDVLTSAAGGSFGGDTNRTNWLAFQGGTAGGSGTGTSARGNSSVSVGGSIALATGTTAADSILVEPNFRAAGAVTVPIAAGTSTTQQVLVVRFALGATRTTRIDGIGFVDSTITEGTDWVTDPDTTLAGINSIVVTRNTSAYSGDTAGSIVARLYDSTPTAVSLELMLDAAIGSSQHTIEFVRPAGSNVWSVYTDNTLSGTLTAGTGSAFSLRPSFGVVTGAAASRIMVVDTIMAEWNGTR